MSNELISKPSLLKRRLMLPPHAQNDNSNKLLSLPGRNGGKSTFGREVCQEDEVFAKGGNLRIGHVIRNQNELYTSSSGETMVDDGDLEYLRYYDGKHPPTQETTGQEFSGSESRRRQRPINSTSFRVKTDSPPETTPTASPRLAKRAVSVPYVKEETVDNAKFNVGHSSVSNSSNENGSDDCDHGEGDDQFLPKSRRPSDLPQLLQSETPPTTPAKTRRSFATVISRSKSPVTVQRASSLLNPRTRSPVSRLTRLRRRHSTVGSQPSRRVTSIPGCRGNLGNAVAAKSHHQYHSLDTSPSNHLNHRSSYHMPISPLATTSSHCIAGCKSPRHWTSGRMTPNVFVSKLCLFLLAVYWYHSDCFAVHSAMRTIDTYELSANISIMGYTQSCISWAVSL